MDKDKGEDKDKEKEGDLLIPKERRDYPRVAVTVRVRYRILEDDEKDNALTKNFDPDKIMAELKESRTINVSSSGLLMYVEEEIPVKKFIAVQMYLPFPGMSSACMALGEVMRCDKNGDGHKYMIGVKFLKVLRHNLNKFKFLSLTELLEIKGEDIKLD